MADVIWCNDKSVPTDTSINIPMIGQNETNFGYGINVNGYGALVRLIPSGDNRLSPSLKCPNDNNGGKLSKFTVSDTINGNGDLDYKIGLLTMDEAIFAGNYSFDDGFYNYLWENTGGMKYWTMTPLWFTDVGSEFALNKSRIAQGATEEPVVLSAYIRPSIALKADVQISSGSGTSDDPYIIK